MKKYTFGYCLGRAADSYNGNNNYVPSISKQVNETTEASKGVKSIS